MNLALKDRYESKTKVGTEWGYSSDDGYVITGEVLQDGIWQGVTWIRDASDNLICQNSRAFDIQIRVPKPKAQSIPRIFNEDYIISENKDAYVFYTIEMQAELLLAGTAYAKATLLVDEREVASVMNRIQMTLLLGVTETNTQQKILTTFVPAGSVCRITSEISGNATIALIDFLEVLI